MMIRVILMLSLLSWNIQAQTGDKAGEPQIPPVPADQIPASPVLSPEQALQSFKIARGFRIEQIASEPLVHDPVALTFDPDGRIWVVEMRGYMPNPDGIGESDPTGSIVILEDTDGDGKMDRRTVFLDGLVMPRSLALVQDGLLVAEPPHLWFYQIRDGKAGARIEVANDYAREGDPKLGRKAIAEETANGLTRALDNWIYSANCTTRFRNVHGSWEREPTIFRGEWGIAQDNYGRLAYNSSEDQFRIDLVPSSYLPRNRNYRGAAGVNVDPIQDQRVWPIRLTPGVNRGYRPGILENWKLVHFTAACGPAIYRGDNFPEEFQGNAFVCEPCANLVKRNILTETNGVMAGRQAYDHAEFLASTDERFRPVSAYSGPDGTLYIVDMYRGLIQHHLYLTSYLRTQALARGLEKPLGLGRIYRIVWDGKPRSPKPHLSNVSSAELVHALSHPDGWWRDTAQRLLVERADAASVPALRELAATGPQPLGRLHALWTLEGMESLDEKTLLAALSDSDGKVQAAAIRLSEPFLKATARNELTSRILALVHESNPDVQLQLAFTLSTIDNPQALQGMALIAHEFAGNLYIREALFTGLGGRELELLEKLSADPAWRQQSSGRAAFLEGLAKCVFKEAKPERVNRLFQLANSSPGWHRLAFLDGVISTAPHEDNHRSDFRSKPVRFPAEPPGYVALRQLDDNGPGNRVERIGRLITWPGQPGYVPPPVVQPLNPDQQKLFALGQTLFSTSCAACHQPHGFGQEGLAPPLAESEWVLGSPQRLIRIILQGGGGPIRVNGRTYSLDMPSWKIFDDEQIAAILTYVRREWENTGSPVDTDLVKKIRLATATREEAWTAEELERIP
jgi:mono/diheme cytochrome c family protein